MSDIPPSDSPPRLSLRELPLPARFVLSMFLISVGVGYLSPLVQLHFQHAKPGSLLPSGAEAADVYHGPTGPRPMSKIEQLLEADESLSFNGTGQMSAAFTKRSDGWRKELQGRTRRGNPAEEEKALRAERDGERNAF